MGEAFVRTGLMKRRGGGGVNDWIEKERKKNLEDKSHAKTQRSSLIALARAYRTALYRRLPKVDRPLEGDRG